MSELKGNNDPKKVIFTEEQRQFMLRNREIAREKLKLKLQKKKKEKNIEDEIIVIDDDNDNDNKSQSTESTAKPRSINDIIGSSIIDNDQDSNNRKKGRKRKLVYCDYNLSEIVDTKGGFLIEKNDDEYEKEKEPEKKIKYDMRKYELFHIENIYNVINCHYKFKII